MKKSLLLTPLLVALLSLAGAGISFGQITSFIQYGTESGLIQSQVQTINQDNNGNLWIGTLAGVSRFDGRKFHSYNKRTGLAEDWITSSLFDKEGNLWYGHWGGGLTKLNCKTMLFENFKFEEVCKFKSVTAIQEDKNNNIWLSTNGGGIYKLNKETKKFIAITENEGLSSNYATCLAFDNDENLWIGTDKGISVLTNTKTAITTGDILIYNTNNGLHADNITALANVFDGEIWAGSENGGIMIIVANKIKSVKQLHSLNHVKSAIINKEQNLSDYYIQKITQDRKNNIWIATKKGGVIKYIPASYINRNLNPAEGSFTSYNMLQGLSYHNVNTLFQDRENNIWIGTDLGLNMYQGDKFKLFDENFGLPNNIVWSVLCDNNNEVWLGTNDGLCKIKTIVALNEEAANPSQQNTILKQYELTRYGASSGLTSDIIISMHEDNQGNLWFGSYEGGVYMRKRDSDKFYHLTESDGLADNTVYTINSDDAGNIWFGTKQGASKYNPTDRVFTNYNSRNGLGGNYIYRIFKDSRGNLWFGALGGYLTMFDGSNFKIFDDNKGFYSRFILSIAEDANKNLWFGAYGNGLIKYDGKKFSSLTTEDGLSSDSPYSLIVDNENHLWIGTNQGVDKYNIKENSFVHYGRFEGFSGIEVNANAVSMDKSNTLWFGTIMGAVNIDLNEESHNHIEPAISISGLKIYNKDTEWPDNNQFAYNQNHLTFQFTAVSLSNPKNIKYQYFLEGFDEDWDPVTSSTEAVYTNLPAGHYRFLVKAQNSDGIWNKQPLVYEFDIATPLWQTWWFRIFMVFAFAFAILMSIRIRTNKLQSDKIALEEKVKERTYELAKKNKELEVKNKNITDSINYAKRIQESVLPDKQKIKNSFPESFIIYKPKDIVSGDFYFFTEKDNQTIVATVDCTGHGVPGAFMSVLGANLLSQIVNEQNVTEPAQILKLMHIKVLQALHKNEKSNTADDGMDMGLICFDRNKRTIQFAGAVRPMYYQSKTGLQEIKGTRHSIGGVMDVDTVKFESIKLEPSHGDTIYMFTDGVVDQFGGEKGKKFMAQRFKDTLSKIQDKNMHEQKDALENVIENWKGDHEQIDDILIIGVRI